MSLANLYPESPRDVPANLTEAKPSYKRQAILAMLGLMAFMAIYLAVTAGFAYITYKNAVRLSTPGDFGILSAIMLVCSAILTVFMVKSLFAMRKMGTPRGIEVTEADQPQLYAFLHQLADEIGAPKPHRVFITPEVNAAVFYDLSLLNLIIPSKKNLIVGLGLVNVLTLTELKAVLAHEFGHFAQNSMMVGRWVYVAQQIIAHMVSVRDWLDSVVQFISRIDLRIAWIGWILSLIIWSLRSLMDTLFNIVIIAERALSREMEFNADLVAVSVTGSDALINALYKLQAADQAWRTAMDVAGNVGNNKQILNDLFAAQSETIKEMRRILDDANYGLPPAATGDAVSHRVFEEAAAIPPQMWSTHPPNTDRENNAKATYVPAINDDRSAWLLFKGSENLRQKLSLDFYNQEAVKGFAIGNPAEAVSAKFSDISYSPEYRGAYLGRSPVRDFASVDQMFDMSDVTEGKIDLEMLYPETINLDLKAVRNLEVEQNTLEALMTGQMKPSGGVLRHRGEEISKEDIPEAIEDLKAEKKTALQKLMLHEANCRKTYYLLAQKHQNGWPEHLRNTLELLHCSDHMLATVSNEQAQLINTWNVITADGKIGHFEKKRMIKVCETVDSVMTRVSKNLQALELPQSILDDLGVKAKWSEASPIFDFAPVDKKNWPQWTQEAFKVMGNFQGVLSLLHNLFLKELLQSEATLKAHHLAGTTPEPAPKAGKCVTDYPTLLSGDEYVLQKKLDLWNRFQLAHGLGPSLVRTLVAVTIVGGTIYAGFVGLG
ncbi:M48 family metallopeptidase [Litorimonas sp. RW-G-Af-16]|uniref:M48 family metallopeptidase n=1 Tax=Litorimonas sp. RW-G-Af-16 TaxID=3241168 RepID=UPI00390C76C8